MDKFEDLIFREPMCDLYPKPLTPLRLIIAMKGDPYTGKTTCADVIAKHYGCSVVSFDDILGSLSPSAAPSPEDADLLFKLAFSVVFQTVRSQLETGRPVVVDSALTDPFHLEHLLKLADLYQCGDDSCHLLHCGFVIVECRPAVKYAWQMRFEQDHQATTSSSSNKCWFKPKEWSEVRHTRSVEDYPPSQLRKYVSRLIVNTTGYVNYQNLGRATYDLCHHPQPRPRNFHDFLILTSAHHSGGDGIECGNDGRHLLVESRLVESNDELGCCRACLVQITDHDPSYACKRCKRLALHKACAELEEKTEIYPPHKLPAFLRKDLTSPPSHDSFPEDYRFSCAGCRIAGREFTVDCESCLWETHLRSALVPTLVRHEGHSPDHFMCFWITSRANAREYQCGACKLSGASVGYTCSQSTFWFDLHVECALLPRVVRHVHGGHEHDMRLVFGDVNVDEEDYLCDECLGLRDPSAWYYYCDQCVFASHLHCVYESTGNLSN